MRVSQAIPLFYSSTSDPGTFDRWATLCAVCDYVGTTNSVVIHVLHWKKNIGGGVGLSSGQDVIDDAVSGNYDIYFGCLGTKYGEGTIREFKNAMDGHINSGDPKEILFGFDESPVNPFSLDRNFYKVAKFRADLQSPKRFGRSILYFPFSNEREFRERALANLDAAVKRLLARVVGGVRISGH